jgi:hypothetical protein
MYEFPALPCPAPFLLVTSNLFSGFLVTSAGADAKYPAPGNRPDGPVYVAAGRDTPSLTVFKDSESFVKSRIIDGLWLNRVTPVSFRGDIYPENLLT